MELETVWLVKALIPVLPKHTLFKVLYFILAKLKNYKYFISVKYFKNTFF